VTCFVRRDETPTLSGIHQACLSLDAAVRRKYASSLPLWVHLLNDMVATTIVCVCCAAAAGGHTVAHNQE
jgi:hypothetical protein